MPSLLAIDIPVEQSFIGKQWVFVETKENWIDEWEYQTTLQPLISINEVGPKMSRASFIWRFGRIKHEFETAFDEEFKLKLGGHYVRILIEDKDIEANGDIVEEEGNEPVPIWIGTIEDQNYRFVSPTEDEGDLLITAFGMENFLDRIMIDRSFCVADADELVPVESRRPLAFNGSWYEEGKSQFRVRTRYGNRSTDKEKDPLGAPIDNGTFLFSQNGEEWTNRQIVEYLIRHFVVPAAGPLTQFEWVLDGDVEALDFINYEQTLFGKTVWEAFNILINRRAGMGFYLDVVEIPDDPELLPEDQEPDTIHIVVFTIVENAIGKLPANPRVTSLELFPDHPLSHIIDTPSIRFNRFNRYDEIEVLGETIKVMASFDADQSSIRPRPLITGSVVEGWSVALQDEFRLAAALGANPDPVDVARFRSQDKFDPVYRRFVVKAFVPKVNTGVEMHAAGGENIGFSFNAGQLVNNDTGNIFPFNRKFFKYLPLEVGLDYSKAVGDPAFDALRVLDQEPEWKPFMVYFTDVSDGQFHKATIKQHFVDKLAETIPEALVSCSVQILDWELGFQLKPNFPEAFANNTTFLGFGANAAKGGAGLPEFDYARLGCTGFFELDERVSILRQIPVAIGAVFPDSVRKLTVNLSGVELWVAAEGAFVDIDFEGQIKAIHPTQQILRDDTERLKNISDYLVAWYSVERHAIEVPISQLGWFVDLGDLILNIEAVGFEDIPVKTVVTSRHIDYTDRITTIETGWGSLDLAQEFINDPIAFG